VSKTIHNQTYKALIAELKKARRAAGLTQQDVADALDKPQSYVAKTEGYERRLDIIELMEYCEAVSVDKRQIFKICLGS